MEEFFLLTKINKKNKINLKQFYKFLKEENIEYKEKLEEEWIGIRQPKYNANIAFYISKKDEVKVRKYIEELENAIKQTEEYKELKEYTDQEKTIEDKEFEKYEKRQKRLQKIMIYGIFLVVAFGIVLTVITNLS